MFIKLTCNRAGILFNLDRVVMIEPLVAHGSRVLLMAEKLETFSVDESVKDIEACLRKAGGPGGLADPPKERP